MISQQTDSLIDDFVERSKEILRDNLVGVYLHGSLVMGCFNPQRSDIDLIIVVDEPLSDPVKRAYMDMAVGLNSCGPAKGIEMSIVLRKVCKPFVYPTPFELHFSSGHLEWYRAHPNDYIREMNGTDKDLAAHFTIIRNRGRCLYGLPIEKVFGILPKRDYFDSIWFDVEEAREDIKENPPYVILNLARVLAYCREEAVLSKKEGGEWALLNLPPEFHSLIQNALNEYTKNENVVYDAELSEKYAEYMLNKISVFVVDFDK